MQNKSYQTLMAGDRGGGDSDDDILMSLPAHSAVERHFKREFVAQVQNCTEAPNEFALSGPFVFLYVVHHIALKSFAKCQRSLSAC